MWSLTGQITGKLRILPWIRITIWHGKLQKTLWSFLKMKTGYFHFPPKKKLYSSVVLPLIRVIRAVEALISTVTKFQVPWMPYKMWPRSLTLKVFPTQQMCIRMSLPVRQYLLRRRLIKLSFLPVFRTALSPKAMTVPICSFLPARIC